MAVHQFHVNTSMPWAKHREVQIRWSSLVQQCEEVVREMFPHVFHHVVQVSLVIARYCARLCHTGNLKLAEH